MSLQKLVLLSLFIYFSVDAYSQTIDPNVLSSAQTEELQLQLQKYQKEQQEQFKQFQNQQGSGSGSDFSGEKSIPAQKNVLNAPAKAGQFTQNPVKVFDSKELEKSLAARIKDPFMLPNQLFFKIKRKLGDIQGEGYVDESVVPQKRWAMKHYKLVAIIWNVKKPKAMITDRKSDIHIFYVNDHIGNNEGVITAIRSGEVVIAEKGAEIKLKMQ
ncbi:MAG: hypothetical protein ABL930_08870 [Pseudobdellovibrio sp.]